MVNHFADMLGYDVEPVMLYQASFMGLYILLYVCVILRVKSQRRMASLRKNIIYFIMFVSYKYILTIFSVSK